MPGIHGAGFRLISHDMGICASPQLNGSFSPVSELRIQDEGVCCE